MRPSPPAAVPGLRRVINAWGTATPFGVSCSEVQVAQAVALMLRRHVVMAELQAQAGRRVAQWSGATAGCVTHCTAAAITLAVAACMTASDAARIAQLPDVSGMPSRVMMLAAHQVNYGHAITQAVRLAGAQVVVCADFEEMQAALGVPGVACVLAVESHLAEGSGTAVTRELVGLAHGAGVPLVLDGAAQDWRVADMMATGADLVLVSAQKYLGGPTAGLVAGRADLVAAVDAQHGGIGRAMKPSKEALAGVSPRWTCAKRRTARRGALHRPRRSTSSRRLRRSGPAFRSAAKPTRRATGWNVCGWRWQMRQAWCGGCVRPTRWWRSRRTVWRRDRSGWS